MPDDAHPVAFVFSSAPRLVAALETSLEGSGMDVRVVSTPDAVSEVARGPRVPGLVLIDAASAGAPVERMLAGLRKGKDDRRFPVVVISDDGSPDWKDRLNQGAIDDLFPPEMPFSHWRARVDSVLHSFRHMRELEHLRASTRSDPDALTGLSNRGTFLSMLFPETDRVQRMKISLSLILFEVDDFAQWRARLSVTGCDDVIKQLVGRIQRLLRSYDLFARTGETAFALGLPGCSVVNAVSLAGRIRAEVLNVPFQAGQTKVCLSSSFGVAPSLGRSPLVVLREAEQALAEAKVAGPGAIHTSRDCFQSPPPAESVSAAAPMDRGSR